LTISQLDHSGTVSTLSLITLLKVHSIHLKKTSKFQTRAYNNTIIE